MDNFDGRKQIAIRAENNGTIVYIVDGVLDNLQSDVDISSFFFVCQKASVAVMASGIFPHKTTMHNFDTCAAKDLDITFVP